MSNILEVYRTARNLITIDYVDFSTMERKLENDTYPDFDSFVSDAQLVFSNCRTYNPENSAYSKRAVRMERFLKDYLAKAQKV